MAFKPAIVLVPGVFEGPESWDGVKSRLEALEYDVEVLKLESTGTTHLGFKDDVAQINLELRALISNAARDVVVVAHSAGGFIAAHATKGLDKKKREAIGLGGGVLRYVFVTAALLPQGQVHPGPSTRPFCDIQGDKVYCKDPRNTFFNDLAEDKAMEEAARLSFQPSEGWEMTIEHAGWSETPSSYMICTRDNALPLSKQQQIVDMAKCDLVESIDAGHCVQITKPDAVVDFITKSCSR